MRFLFALLVSFLMTAEAFACQMHRFELTDIKRADLVIKAELVSYDWQRSDRSSNGVIRVRTSETWKGEKRATWQLYWRGSRSETWDYGKAFVIAAINPRKLRWLDLEADWTIKPSEGPDMFHVVHPTCSNAFIFQVSLTDEQRSSIRRSVMDIKNEIPLLIDERTTPTVAEANLIAEIEEARVADMQVTLQQIRSLLSSRRKIPSEK